MVKIVVPFVMLAYHICCCVKQRVKVVDILFKFFNPLFKAEKLNWAGFCQINGIHRTAHSLAQSTTRYQIPVVPPPKPANGWHGT